MSAVDLITIAEYKAQAELTDSSSDPVITPLITAASRALQNRCSRELTPMTDDATRTFRVTARRAGHPVIVDFQKYDLRSVITAQLNPEASAPQALVANQDYALWPTGGDSITNTYLGFSLSRFLYPAGSDFAIRFGYAQLEVRGAWGAWATGDVHEEVKRACCVTVASWLDRAVQDYQLDDGSGQPRLVRPDKFAGWAVPNAALSILWDAGLRRGTTV